MPRAYLTKEDELNSRLVALVYGTMKVKHVTQTQMADKLGISQPAFGKKLKKCQFSFLDLVTIFDVLGFEDDQVASVMRRK